MRASILPLALAALTAAAPGPAALHAQSRAGVGIGERVRVTTPGVPGRDRYSGRVVAVSEDSLTLHRDGARAAHTIALSSIAKVERSRGTKSNGWRGAGYGLLGGAAVGTVFGLVTHRAKRGDCYFLAGCTADYRAEKSVSPAAGAALGAVAGAVVGAVVGRFHRTDRWVAAPRDGRVGASAAPGRGAMAAVSGSF